MKNKKYNSKLLIIFAGYIFVIVSILVWNFYLSARSVKSARKSDIASLNTSLIENLYKKVEDRSSYNFTGEPDLTRFEFGNAEPF